MTDFILLDANILILAFDTALQKDDEKTESTLAEQQKAIEIIEEISNSSNTKIAITSLIRYEVLRGIKHRAFDEMKAILDDEDVFFVFDVDKQESDFASKVFRFGKYGDRPNIDKHNFDIFHYAVAEANELEWKTLDEKDWQKIDDVVADAKQSGFL